MLNFHLAPLKIAVQPPWRFAVGVAFAAACAVTASHAQTAAPVARTAQPVKVALIECLSGTFANTGEAVFRNILWAVDRVNARGGVLLPSEAGGARALAGRHPAGLVVDDGLGVQDPGTCLPCHPIRTTGGWWRCIVGSFLLYSSEAVDDM